MKKMIIASTAVLTLSIASHYIAEDPHSSSSKPIEKKIISDHAKTDSFESLNGLEQKSPIIVIGKKVGKLSTQVRKSKVNPDLVSGWTESEFLIKKVIKNEENNEKIKVNSKITIGEMSFEYNGVIHTVNGYEEMKNGKDYLLFLVEQDGLFATRGVTFGKIPLDNTDLEIYSEGGLEDSHLSEISSIFKEARKKYSK
ncbi:hypothetical protein [Anoxybacteroides rupiense]|uniref:Uncharacterized protein n=1 Tax=Anoxybacteroides rupiense TaxID=311460 RepID=A0ABD5IW88_9BACL|nr:hypothetical protein [Anoxybacillus rupiensis]MBB3905939.1 hypothetical protein [Anoxybacillus rupiensis]MED5051661.1 hypothetical protein [Anoxybacillus rupiensis]